MLHSMILSEQRGNDEQKDRNDEEKYPCAMKKFMNRGKIYTDEDKKRNHAEKIYDKEENT